MTTTTKQMNSSTFEFISPRRQRTMGIVFLLFAALIFGFFSRGLDSNLVSTYKMSPGGSDVVVSDWVIQSSLWVNVLGGTCAVLGAYQLARGFKKWTNLVLGLVSAFFVFAFLTWATADQSLNLAGLINSSLIKAVPLTLGAMAGILCERSGVVNIAIEGMMLSGAFIATLVGSLTNIWGGLLAAVLFGGILGLLHAVLSIKYKADQVISGTMINILSTGLTSFFSAKFLQKYQHLNDPGRFATWDIPGLSKIPFIGPIFFSNNMFVYAMFFFIVVLTVALYYTRWGLRLRAVGEHPKAADTLGIDVYKTRYVAVVLGGMMAGFGGAYFTLGSVGRFDEVMTAGRGFISLAAMIFGNFVPGGAFAAGTLFGFADALASKLAILRVPIPSEFLLMAPYLVTMIVLAGVVGRTQVPAADGVPYDKE
jgi:general nucleoside transport system permease protein